MDLYERHARQFDRDRGRSLQEKAWLDQFLSDVPPKGVVLDLGCGMAEPIARYIIERGFRVVGVDSSPTLIGMCRARFPESEWIVGDMRQLALGRRFDGVLAWDSFFHLTMDDQRAMFGRFAAHARPGAPLMFTSGPRHGEEIGSYAGEPLYHASLDPSEYEQLLGANGFSVLAFRADDADCGDHTVWLVKQNMSRNMAIHKIISGGQTGADRAALDAARAWGTAVGGWIPAGRTAEDGQVPREFVELVETATDAPEERTGLNVRDSDGTLLVSHGALTGGSALTLEQATALRKPALHLDLDRIPLADGIRQALSWIRANQISCLNVAGPRASEDPRAYDATFAVVFGLLSATAS